MAIVAGSLIEMFQMDVKNVFLDVDLEKEVYVVLSVYLDPFMV